MKQMKQKKKAIAHKDESRPEFTSALYTKFLGLEGRRVNQYPQLKYVGQTAAFAPHRTMLPLRDMNAEYRSQGYVVQPNLGPACFTAKPFTGMDPLGMQLKPRYRQGNSDWQHKKDLWRGRINS